MTVTSLPRIEDLPQTGDGAYEPQGVREAFDGFRRHALQLQAQLPLRAQFRCPSRSQA